MEAGANAVWVGPLSTRNNKRQRPDSGDGESANAFLPEDAALCLAKLAHPGGIVYFFPDFAFSADRQPTIFEFFSCHAEAVISKHQQVMRPKEVNFNPSSESIIGIFEQLMNCRRNAHDLLPTKKIDSTSPDFD
jgi:hypothetical protein